MRYFLGLGEIAGVLEGMATGLRQLGREADLILTLPHEFSYSKDDNVLTTLFFRLHFLRQRHRILFYALFPAKQLLMLILFAYSLYRYDAFIFTGFNSFFHFYELPILKLFRKKIVVIFLGSDSRPPYLSGAYLDMDDGMSHPAQECVKARWMRKRIKRIEASADLIVCSTATAQFIHRLFVPGLQIGVPVNVSRIVAIAKRAVAPQSHSAAADVQVLRIVHAPSRPRAKGSEAIRRVIGELNQELAVAGIWLDLIELKGVSNEEVVNTLANCDFVINELYSDTFMSVLDAEAAALGKPSLKFGYYADRIVLDNPGAPIPEYLLYFMPDDLKDVVRTFSTDANLRQRAGDNVRKFVEVHWSAKSVAKRLEDNLLLGAAARYANPIELDYLYGWGLPLNAWCENLHKYIEAVGTEGLMLPPHLEMLLRQRLANVKTCAS